MNKNRLRRSRSMILLAVVLVGVAVAATMRLSGSAPSLAAPADESAVLTAPVAVPNLPRITPLDVDAIDVVLQVDTTRASHRDVAAQLERRLVDAPDDHVTTTLLAASLLADASATADRARYRDATAAAERALELAPASTDARLVLAQVRAAAHDFEGALDLVQQVLELDPDSDAARALQVDAHLELGNVSLADALVDQLAGDRPEATVLSRQARVAFVSGDSQLAIDRAVEALGAAANLPLRPAEAAFYWFQLGSYLEKSGQVDGAAAAIDRALAIDPQNGGALELLVRVREAQGRTDEAIALLRDLVGDGGAGDLHGELARLLGDAGEHDEAAEQLAIALDVSLRALADNPAERRHVANFLVDHAPEPALDAARLEVDQRGDGGAYHLLAKALLATGDIEAATDAVDAALAVGTVDAELYVTVAEIASAGGDTPRARAFAHAALTLHPQLPGLSGEVARAIAS